MRVAESGKHYASAVHCRKELDLSIPTHKSGSFLGLVENDTRGGVFFTKPTGRLLFKVAMNNAQATESRFRTIA
jgi:hypothetical protein